MAQLVSLMSAPVRVTDADKQDLRLSANVAQFDNLELLLNVYEGTDVAVKIITGMQIESEDGWVELASFTTTSAAESTKRSFSNPLAFVRWEVTSSVDATFMITGVGRQT